MRVITISTLTGKNYYNLCILGENTKNTESIESVIKSVFLQDFEDCEGNYYVHVEQAKHGDFVVVITTDQYVEPVAVHLAQVQTVSVYGT
jgi:hypothetical protein